MVNLNMVSDVKVLQEASDTNVPEPPAMNLQRVRIQTQNYFSTEVLSCTCMWFQIQSRINASLDRKKQMIKAFKTGVSPEGQRLFQYISKT